MEITKDIRYIGVNDHDIDLFEGQYDVSENGMAYNSYVILGEKIAVADSVDAGFVDEWLGNLDAVLNGRTPDYLVVHHMEPDHSAGIATFMERYPQAQIVASMGAFRMMVNYFGTDFPERKMVVKEGDVLDLGGHSLTFVGAPNVHWPEVLFSYESTDKVLFSADGFGKFGANDIEDPEGWACEARRYYFGIVGKFGKFVQAVLKIAVQVVDAFVGWHMPVRAVNGDRGTRSVVGHRADGRAKAGGVVKVILELIEAQHHIAHVAGNVGHIDTKHGGAIVHNANADLGPVEGVTMNGSTARRGAEKLGSDHLVPNIEVFRTNCSANRRDYHYIPLKQGYFSQKSDDWNCAGVHF